MFLADLHVHSRYSDGRLTIAELVDFYGVRGFGAISVTDHICEAATVMGLAAKYMNITLTKASFANYMDDLCEQAERAWKTYRMLVLPGFEITKNSFFNHRSAHILGIGIREFLPAGGDARDIARTIRAQGGVAVAAHPVPTGKAEIQTLHLWNRREELREEFDAWEVASGTELFSAVEESDLPKLATSDFHTPKNITGWKTAFFCERHPEAMLQAIRSQNIEFRFFAEPCYKPGACGSLSLAY